MSGSNSGLFGMDPDTARNLLMFGASTMAAANARTPQGFLAYGAGALGPIGAGLMGMNEQGMQQAKLRSELAYQRAQTRNVNTQADINQMAIPQIQQGLTLASQAMNAQPSPSSGGMGGAPISANSYSSFILNHEGTGKNPNSSAQGYGGFINGTWDQFRQENPALFAGVRGDGRDDPALGATAAEWYARKNAPALASAGVEPNGQSLALSHYLGPQAAAAVMKAPDNAPVAAVLPGVIGEANTAEYLKANPPLTRQTVGQLKGQYANVPTPDFVRGNSGGTQYAQAGNVATDATPLGAGAPQQQQGAALPNISPQQAWAEAQRLSAIARSLGANPHLAAMSQRYQEQANQYFNLATGGLKDIQGKGFTMGPNGQAAPIPGGPADPSYIGQSEAAKTANTITTDRNGNRYLGTTFIGRGPEVKPVWNPQTKQYEWGDVGGLDATGRSMQTGNAGGGNIQGPGPVEKGMLEAQPQQLSADINHDRKTVEEDLAHVLDNVVPAKQQLFQLRNLIDAAQPGAAGQLRADFKNWVQTFAPDFVSQVTGDASPAQEFNKIALMGAGKQERGDLGARGGFRAIEMYVKANPNLDMQPQANHDMANALLISHQFHEDYATGATSWYNQNHDAFMEPNNPGRYNPISKYDNQFVGTMRPELYAAAISAINGKPYTEWSKGMTTNQQRIIGGIIQRADPSAAIDLGSHTPVPVSKLKMVIGPTDIVGNPGGR